MILAKHFGSQDSQRSTAHTWKAAVLTFFLLTALQLQTFMTRQIDGYGLNLIRRKSLESARREHSHPAGPRVLSFLGDPTPRALQVPATAVFLHHVPRVP